MVSRKTRIREFETDAATEACLAMMHNKVPAKKADSGSFTIPCSIGNNYSTKALCDPGASINLIPKSVFRKLDIGEAKPTTVMLELVDRSYVQPEGKIEDILVRVDKFIFIVGFLILDCEADEHAPIILGRPFLATDKVIIDFEKEKCGKLCRPETAGSQIHVRSASAASSELGRSLILPGFILTLPTRYKTPTFTFTIHFAFCLLLLIFLSLKFFLKEPKFSAAMETSSSSSAEGLPSRFNSVAAKEWYHNIVAAKNRWEEQGFFFNDELENYGLEPIIYKRYLTSAGYASANNQPGRISVGSESSTPTTLKGKIQSTTSEA
ncbi:hypothetical protein V6N12_058593 [Hibiscus sabdariffa]|uniref:Uncharacterized protein n=1 Tax=Hibiscus sabdariffa TaxID=183260 RepID=A0ABR2ESK7_9ROSI